MAQVFQIDMSATAFCTNFPNKMGKGVCNVLCATYFWHSAFLSGRKILLKESLVA